MEYCKRCGRPIKRSACQELGAALRNLAEIWTASCCKCECDDTQYCECNQQQYGCNESYYCRYMPSHEISPPAQACYHVTQPRQPLVVNPSECPYTQGACPYRPVIRNGLCTEPVHRRVMYQPHGTIPESVIDHSKSKLYTVNTNPARAPDVRYITERHETACPNEMGAAPAPSSRCGPGVCMGSYPVYHEPPFPINMADGFEESQYATRYGVAPRWVEDTVPFGPPNPESLDNCCALAKNLEGTLEKSTLITPAGVLSSEKIDERVSKRRDEWNAEVRNLMCDKPLHIHTIILPPGIKPGDPRLKNARVVAQRSYFTKDPQFPKDAFYGSIDPELDQK